MRKTPSNTPEKKFDPHGFKEVLHGRNSKHFQCSCNQAPTSQRRIIAQTLLKLSCVSIFVPLQQFAPIDG
jgi:hypothetical protein